MNPLETTSQETVASKFAHARSLFPHTSSVVYFNSASYGPLATTIKEAIDRNMDIRIAADRDDTHYAFATADELRSDYAELVGAEKQEIGVGLSTTFGINIAAFGLPLEPGDEVLVLDCDFPVNVYCWRAAAETRGIVLKFIPSRDRHFDIDEFLNAITPRTKVLTVSFVSFFNGYKNDLVTLGKICRERGIFFVVDGIQGVGAETINVREANVDIFACGCQKWMLSPQGCGFFFISDRVRPKMKLPFGTWLGVEWEVKFTDVCHYDKPWFESARRFEMGYYAIWNILGMKEAMKIFQMLGTENIQRHNHALIDRLVTYLRSNPLYAITSSLEEKHRSSIFTFSGPEIAKLHRFILDQKIILVQREGSIRVSAHLFNNEDDIDKLIGVLDRYSKNA